MTPIVKRCLNKVFRYSGLKFVYFKYIRNKDDRKIKCPILLYHSINDALSPRLLDEHLRFLSSTFKIMSLGGLCQGIVNNNLPENPLVITFDDGYKDTYELAAPILEKHQAVATVFVISGRIGGEFEGRAIMTRGQVKDLASRGMEIGAHTVSHPNLKQLSREDLMAELAVSKTKLEDMTQAPVISLAYPTGLYDSRVIEVAEEAGFKIAVTTVHDFFVDPGKLFECPRIAVYPYDSCQDVLEKLNGDQHWLKLGHRLYLPIALKR